VITISVSLEDKLGDIYQESSFKGRHRQFVTDTELYFT